MGGCGSNLARQVDSEQEQKAKQPQDASPPRQQPKRGGSSASAYSVVRDLETNGSHSLKLMQNQATKEYVAAKWVPRKTGAALSQQIQREIINHRKLRHPSIVCFRKAGSLA